MKLRILCALRSAITRGIVGISVSLTLTSATAQPTDIVDAVVTPSGTFSNVSVVSTTETHVTIRSADGSVATLKFSELDPVTQARLKGEPGPGTDSATNRAASGTAEMIGSVLSGDTNVNANIEEAREATADFFKRHVPKQMGTVVLALALGVLFCIYLFYCYCLKLICDKTGNEPGPLIWLPILQWFPLLRAADMSFFWFLLLWVPSLGPVTLAKSFSPAYSFFVLLGLGMLSFVAYAVWCVKIVGARGKHWIVAVLLILPITNFFAFLYLAFSKAAGGADDASPSSAPPLLG